MNRFCMLAQQQIDEQAAEEMMMAMGAGLVIAAIVGAIISLIVGAIVAFLIYKPTQIFPSNFKRSALVWSS